MKCRRFTQEQIISIRKEHQAAPGAAETLPEARRQPVIIVPEGKEIRLWRVAGGHELGRYSGRMYPVVERE